MNINQLLVEQEIKKGYLLLESVTVDMTADQKRIVEGIYNEFVPLFEATLTTTQIKQLFGDLEKQSVEGGANRTVVGAGVDVAKKANEVINNVGKWLQDTTPVKMADQKFEQLKAKVGAKFPDLDTQLTGMGTWMKENPGKSAAIIGVLTALASLAGGPVGGAIAGQVLRGAAELIKGEKLSTAVGKGVKTAVFGFLSGKAFEMLGKFAETLAIKQIPFGPADAGFEEITIGGFEKTLRAPGMEWTRSIPEVDVIVDPEMASALRAATNMLNSGGDAANEGFEQLSAIAKVINSGEYRQNIIDTLEITRQELIKNDSLTQFISAAKNGLQAVSQGAVAASTGSEKKESYYVQTRPLSEGQVYMLFDRVLTEAGFMDKLKAGATNAVGAVAKGAGWVGKQATEKVTSAKLLTAWKLEGSPTDSEELKKFLLNYGGIDQTVIDKVYTDMKIQGDPAQDATQDPKAQTAYAQVKSSLSQLNTKQRKQLMLQLQKQLGTT
jgi:hypothetical protein